MKTITRREKIRMFLDDYYFGYAAWVKMNRVLGGPFLIFVGFYLFDENNTFRAAYAAISFFYGLYMLLRPFLWIYGKRKDFQDEQLSITTDKLGMVIKNETIESRIGFEAFMKIVPKSEYYLFLTDTSARFRLPRHLFSEAEKAILLDQIARNSNH